MKVLEGVKLNRLSVEEIDSFLIQLNDYLIANAHQKEKLVADDGLCDFVNTLRDKNIFQHRRAYLLSSSKSVVAREQMQKRIDALERKLVGLEFVPDAPEIPHDSMVVLNLVNQVKSLEAKLKKHKESTLTPVTSDFAALQELAGARELENQRLRAEVLRLKALIPRLEIEKPLPVKRDAFSQKNVRSSVDRVAVGLTYNPRVPSKSVKDYFEPALLEIKKHQTIRVSDMKSVPGDKRARVLGELEKDQKIIWESGFVHFKS